MQRYQSVFGQIELTDERLRHVLDFHPEVNVYLDKFEDALGKPDHIKPSKYDASVMIFYRSLPRGKWLAIVVKVNARHFVLTAYVTSRIL